MRGGRVGSWDWNWTTRRWTSGDWIFRGSRDWIKTEERRGFGPVFYLGKERANRIAACTEATEGLEGGLIQDGAGNWLGSCNEGGGRMEISTGGIRVG